MPECPRRPRISGTDFIVFKVTEDEAYVAIRGVSVRELGNNRRVILMPPAP